MGRLEAILDRREATLGRFDALLDCLGALSGPSWSFLEALEAPRGAFRSWSPPPLNGILDPRGGGKGEGDSQMSHTPFHPRQAGVGGFILDVSGNCLRFRNIR